MGHLGNFEALPFTVQLGHITAEVTRARVWAERGDDPQLHEALSRVIELLGVFLSGSMPRGLRREMARLQEVVAQFYEGQTIYNLTLADLENYLLSLFIVLRK